MALADRLQFFPPLSSIHFRKPNSMNFHPLCSLHYDSSFTSYSSPFTEKHSIQRYQRDHWLYKNQVEQITSCSFPPGSHLNRENNIALQLPELKKLLQVLGQKRESEEHSKGNFGPGNVFLVGTGPGDPELLTLKAVRVIQSADLLLYDRLVSNDVLDLIGPNARLLYVGKTAGYHSRTQVKKYLYILASLSLGFAGFLWFSARLLPQTQPLYFSSSPFFFGNFSHWVFVFLLNHNQFCKINHRVFELGLWTCYFFTSKKSM